MEIQRTRHPPGPFSRPEPPEELYLDLLKKCLTRYGLGSSYRPLKNQESLMGRVVCLLNRLLSKAHLELVRAEPFRPEVRDLGLDWPTDAETMIGLKGLDNLHFCIKEVLRRRVPGDLIETGVWRGGATIFMRAALMAYGDTDRIVWAADSFQGLPNPDAKRFPADAGDPYWSFTELAVSLDDVKKNFAKYGLLDWQVCFLVGWFRDTLPTAPIERLAVLRLDGDMYESTIEALDALYPKLSVGGYAIIDDYHAVKGCKAAVDDYRAKHGITDELRPVAVSNDQRGVYWQKGR